MESIGQLTIDDSGGLAIPHDICEQLGFAPGETLAVERGVHGEVSLKALSHPESKKVIEGVAQVQEMKLVEENGVLVFKLQDEEPLPDVAMEWLSNPLKHDRELRMRELMRGGGLEGFD